MKSKVFSRSRLRFFFILAMTSTLRCCWCCRSSHVKSSRPYSSNEIEPFPSLFSVINDVKEQRTICPKSYPINSCKIVKVNLDAFESSTMNFPVPFDGTTFTGGKSISLKKTTEEGLKMVLADTNTPATATVTYKFRDQSIAFVVKKGKIFSSINLEGRITLKPCLQQKPYNCHILLHKIKPS